jgi:succinate dehydrogenase / fumarate reductase iron-sulfur subunit
MSAKISHLVLLPQGAVEGRRRVVSMIQQADAEGFGSCSNEGECEAVCPKEIPISNIARMTREYLKALLSA